MSTPRIALQVIASAAIVIAPAASEGQSCGADGYLLAASSPMPTAADSSYLQAAAHSLAYRWPVPSRRRETYTNWRRVRKRALPPEPRWADDWEPAGGLRLDRRSN